MGNGFKPPPSEPVRKIQFVQLKLKPKPTGTDYNTVVKELKNTFKIPVYDINNPRLSSLKQHLKTEHMEKFEHKCDICWKLLTSKQHFKNHQRIYTITKAEEKEEPTTSYICQKCGKSFELKMYLRRHEKLVHEGIPKRHICEICGMMYHVRAKLRYHMMKHTGEKPFVCEICGMCFGVKQFLKNHQICHSDLRPYKCKVCGKTFKRLRNMKEHELSMHYLVNAKPEQGKDGINYPCIVCKTEFLTNQKLKIHMRCHGSSVEFPCVICEKVLPSKQRHDNHMKSHTGEFGCVICGKVLTSKDGLGNHMRTHTGERPFVCDVCGFAVKTRGHLIQHRRTHTDDKPFPCKICDKRFRRRANLEVHIRTHTGEKPFVCDICGRGFSQIGDMKKHRLKIHSKDPKQ